MFVLQSEVMNLNSKAKECYKPGHYMVLKIANSVAIVFARLSQTFLAYVNTFFATELVS